MIESQVPQSDAPDRGIAEDDGGRGDRAGTDWSEPFAAGDAGQRVPVRWGWLDGLWLFLLALLAFTVSTLGVTHAISLSPFDEASHASYAYSLAHGELPFAGSKMPAEVLEEWSCRSQQGVQYILPPCGGHHDAAEYPMRGENYNYFHPPTYYAATAVGAKLLLAMPGDMTFITAARLTGGVWLAAALVGLYAVLRLWRTSRLVAVSAAVVVAAVPSVAHASSIVTNDAPGPLMGVLALWVLTRVMVQGRLGWVIPAVVSLVIASTKVMHSVSILAVAGILIFVAVAAFRAGDRARARALAIISVAIVGATAVVYFGWSAFQATRAVPNWVSPALGINTDPIVGTPIAEWVPTLFSTFGISQTYFLQNTLTSFAIVGSARGLSLLLSAAPFANVAAFAVGDPRRLLGWTALVGCAAVPLLVQAQAYMDDHGYFPVVSSRYGISLLPIVIAAFAVVAHLRNWRVATVVVAAGSIGAILLSFTGIL
jgi:hypothetical protein